MRCCRHVGEDLAVKLKGGGSAIEEHVMRNVLSIRHIWCTCRVGSDDAPSLVTDPQGRVRGTVGLRVCDASIFPAVPRANTNIPTLMTAEKIADAILSA